MSVLLAGIIAAGAILSIILSYLNAQSRKKEIPEEINDIYDETHYAKSQMYGKENTKLSVSETIIDTLILIIFLPAGGFAFVDEISRSVFDSEILAGLLFFGILTSASLLFGLPFDIYGTFVVEEKYGFNKMNAKLYIADKIKGILISAFIGGGLLAFIMWFYEQTQDYFWIYAWVVITVFMLFMSMFYSNLIVPLFNKQKPLDDGELRDMIEAFGEKAGFPVKEIYVIDGSKRSTKANAYFTGLGKKKRIVLYDTLIDDLDNEEIVAVLAHEIGHYKKKHNTTGLIAGIIQTGVLLFIFSLLAGNPLLSKALGSDTPSFHLSLVAFGILYTPLSTFVGFFMNALSRKNEYQADAFAKSYGYADYLISALKKMSRKHLSNLTPHPAFVFAYYSHPTLFQRIKAIQDGKRN